MDQNERKQEAEKPNADADISHQRGASRFIPVHEPNPNEHQEHDEELEFFTNDPQIASKDAPVPTWLKFFYITLPIWGFISFSLFWNGTHGWVDSGHWNQLQKAALTTFPTETIEGLNKDSVPQK